MFKIRHKMYYVYIFVLIIAVVRVSTMLDFQDEGLAHRIEEYGEERGLPLEAMRCTRRFTPGACIDRVQPVWYFMFHIQNCTERLGCLASYRSNRFPSYQNCMATCGVIIKLYMQILMYGSNVTVAGNTDNSSRRADLDYVFIDTKVPNGVIDNITLGGQDEDNMGDSLTHLLEEDAVPIDEMYSDVYKERPQDLDAVLPLEIDYEMDGDAA